MSLSKELSALLDNQRVVLNTRVEMCGLRKKQYGLWATKLKRAGHEDKGNLVERTFVDYFDQELLSLQFLLEALKEAQSKILSTVGEWEAQANDSNG